MAGAPLGLVLGSGVEGIESPPANIVVLMRHGSPSYALPHDIDHLTNMRLLLDAGCERVLAIGSVGGLRPELGPGTLVCPDDFIALDTAPLTALDGRGAHRVPGFDANLRRDLLAALGDAGADVQDGGVYWQASGPRLETPAEIRFVAAHADVIGMTIASESVIAAELGLRYAALCVVDNLANGIADTELSLAQIEANRTRTRAIVVAAIVAALPRLA